MILPEQYNSTPVLELLQEAVKGRIGFDRRLARALSSRGDAVVDQIVRFAMEERDDDRVAIEDELLDTLRVIGSEGALPFYLQYLRRHVETTMDEPGEELMAAIRATGAAAVTPLVELYEQVGEEQGGDIAMLLASLRVPDPRVIKILQERLEYDALDGIILLGMYRHPDAKRILEDYRAKLVRNDTDFEDLDRECQYALEHFDGEAEEFPAPGDPLENFAEQGDPVFPVLDEAERMEFLDSPSDEHRLGAVGFYFNDEYEKPVRDKLLAMARGDASLAVRARAWEALGSVMDDKEVLQALERKLADESAPLEERTGALVGMALAPDHGDISVWVHRFIAQPETRAKALEAIWRSIDKSFAPLVPEHLSSGDAAVLRNAVMSVGYLGIASELERLREMFDDDATRDDALFAYALAMPGDVSPGRVRGMLRKIEESAGGLDFMEEKLVEAALDQRLLLHGFEPVFSGSEEGEGDPEQWSEEEPAAAAPATQPKVGRNDPCPCGSGKKYKKCCGA